MNIFILASRFLTNGNRSLVQRGAEVRRDQINLMAVNSLRKLQNKPTVYIRLNAVEEKNIKKNSLTDFSSGNRAGQLAIH